MRISMKFVIYLKLNILSIKYATWCKYFEVYGNAKILFHININLVWTELRKQCGINSNMQFKYLFKIQRCKIDVLLMIKKNFTYFFKREYEF